MRHQDPLETLKSLNQRMAIHQDSPHNGPTDWGPWGSGRKCSKMDLEMPGISTRACLIGLGAREGVRIPLIWGRSNCISLSHGELWPLNSSPPPHWVSWLEQQGRIGEAKGRLPLELPTTTLCPDNIFVLRPPPKLREQTTHGVLGDLTLKPVFPVKKWREAGRATPLRGIMNIIHCLIVQ